jgi:hypothetical protein
LARGHPLDDEVILSEEADSPEARIGGSAVATQAAETMPTETCPTCGTPPTDDQPASHPYVYALGRVEPRFPGVGVERELAHAAAGSDTKGLTDRQVLHKLLKSREGRYLARQLCYVFVIGGLETYALVTHDSADLDLLIDAVRPDPKPEDMDLVVGVRGPLSTPQMCNGLIVPVVAFSQLYSFDRNSLVKSAPRPGGIAKNEFEATVSEIVDTIVQMTDNAGATDEHRALNWLAVRGGGTVYAHSAEQYQRDFSLAAIEAHPSALGATRTIIDVILTYKSRSSGYAEKSLLRVDTTEPFPFAHAELTPYIDH